MQKIDVSFRLDDWFVNKYKDIPPPFGFNGVGEFTFRRTYSRIKEDGTNEEWYETIRRVVEGCYRMQERHIKANDLGWSPTRAQKSAQEMYDCFFWMKCLPPGRGLWAMGSVLTEGDNPIYAALNNCGFVSTSYIAKEFSKPFCFLMDMSMLGVGIGFDVKGAGAFDIKEPGNIPLTKEHIKAIYPDLPESKDTIDYKGSPVTFNYLPKVNESEDYVFVIPDDREGWVLSVSYLLNAFFQGTILPTFDYSQLRPKGELIKGFGGLSSGSDPLKEVHKRLIDTLNSCIGKPLSVRNIVDIQNMIGCCVVAGNVRRTAEIVFGDPNDEEYLKLKDYRWNSETFEYEGSQAERSDYGWTSNNSIFAEIGMDYTRCGDQTALNGEPGYAWLDNMRNYSRMGGVPDFKDKKVAGANPCVEQSLEHMELCCLVEDFIFRCKTLEEFVRALKFAYLYAKTVTLGKTHWRETNKVLLKNRRIGCSLSGVQQFVAEHGLDTLREWCERGYEAIQKYDEIYSDWMCIPRSIKTTSIKPSGTVSLLAGATPGMHWPENVIYIRRIRVSNDSKLLPGLIEAGYEVEPAVDDPYTSVVSFPVKVSDDVRSVHQVSMWEQLSMAAFLQKYWADNQVSCTVTFNPETEGHQIKHALNYYQYQLKGISFLPKVKHGAYAQMPYEEITEERYNEMMSKIKRLELQEITEEVSNFDRYCDSDRCYVVTK